MEHSKSPRTVLFVSPGPDMARPASGEGTRLQRLSRALSAEWDVIAMIPSTTTADQLDWVRTVYTYDQWSLPFLTDLNPAFVRTLLQALRENDIDIVHLSKGVCATKALSTILRDDTSIVYAAQNVEAQHARDFVAETLPFYKRYLGPRLIPYIERVTVACADAVTTVSETDRRAFIDRYGVDDERIVSIPTGTTVVSETTLTPPEAVRNHYNLRDAPIAVFHGTYSHPPNQEAVEQITEFIAPHVHQQEPRMQFLLVGRDIPTSNQSNVRSIGFVDDLFSVLNVADIAIVPISHGGGTKTKVYDYISLGVPMVATEKAVAGIDIESGRHGFVTPSVDEAFLSALSTLRGDEALQDEMRANLLDLADDWAWSRSAERLGAFYQTLYADES